MRRTPGWGGNGGRAKKTRIRDVRSGQTGHPFLLQTSKFSLFKSTAQEIILKVRCILIKLNQETCQRKNDLRHPPKEGG